MSQSPTPEATPHYRKPGRFTRSLFNPFIEGLTRLGLSVLGSRVLEVKGRKSGLPRRTPVNLLELDGRQYLVSPRGETEWVRNARADGGQLTLILGHRRDERTGIEVADATKPPILRAYLRRWKAEVGVFFDGVSDKSSDDELLRIAPKHPVFELSSREATTHR